MNIIAEVGDTVLIHGFKFIIATLFYSDSYTEWNADINDYGFYHDVEFKDTKGMYHHWKSRFDGGELVKA